MNYAPNSAAARDIANVLHPYTNLRKHEEKGPLIITKGQGVHVWDDQGNRYIEGMAGLWCASLGWNEEELIEAAVKQMRELPYYHGFTHKSSMPSIDLAEKLKSIAPADFSKVFFVNSGSEANDTQVKLVRYYNNAVGRPEKKKIIGRIKGYHGVTVAAASLTGIPLNHKSFDLPIEGVRHTDCPHHYRYAEPGESEEEFSTRLAKNLEELIIKEGPETVAAFIAEPVMGAGGVIVPPEGYFEKIQAVLTKYDVWMIADEVITGFMRTGNMWGSQTFGIRPNTLSCAKQLSSAYLPIAAVMVDDPIYQAIADESKSIGAFGHGYTYSGHPVSAAVALRTLQLYEERNTLAHVQAIYPAFQKRLKALADHPLVGEARGVGLVGAVELVADKPSKREFAATDGVAAQCVEFAQAHGVILRAIGAGAVTICPPLMIEEGQIHEIFDALEKALDDTDGWVNKKGLRQVAA
ncbi:aspartate aminotransferase family protein [Marinibaculum pumilum]|uniref:Aspartate aminotransferase family protein n=1 Tax=Marinibaculum pumilum TaxID=1766165 RepID=A0ABV7L3A0_9PROT